MTTPQQHPPADAGATNDDCDPELERIQADIEQTRAELGETVEALATKVDVKARAQARLTDTKNQAVATFHSAQARVAQLGSSASVPATDEHGQPKPAVIAAAGTAAVLGSVLVIAGWRRYRSTSPARAWFQRR